MRLVNLCATRGVVRVAVTARAKFARSEKGGINRADGGGGGGGGGGARVSPHEARGKTCDFIAVSST